MKTIILIKQHPTVQLGHLYEHLYLRRVNDFFYEQGLFKLLDYAVHGITYEQGGVIAVECELYSDEAARLGHKIESLRIDLGSNNRNISTALHQITAEESEKLYISNPEKVIAELKRLDRDQWQRIDDFTTLDTQTIRRKNAPIYLTNQKQARPHILRLSLHLDRDFATTRRELLPLFTFIGRTILLTACNQVVATHGAYAGGDLSAKAMPPMVTSDLFVARYTRPSLSLDEVARTAQEACTYVCRNKTYDRIVRSLSATSYSSTPQAAPNLERLITETGIVIGEKGWRELTTLESIKDILNHAALEVKLGRQKITFQCN